MRFSAGHAHVGEEHLVEAGRLPVMLRIGRTSMPGRSIGMMKYEMPRCFDTSVRVRAIRMPNLACSASDVQIFCPFTR